MSREERGESRSTILRECALVAVASLLLTVALFGPWLRGSSSGIPDPAAVGNVGAGADARLIVWFLAWAAPPRDAVPTGKPVRFGVRVENKGTADWPALPEPREPGESGLVVLEIGWSDATGAPSARRRPRASGATSFPETPCRCR